MFVEYQYPRKRLLIPQRHSCFQASISVETSFLFVSQRKCFTPSCGICVLHGSMERWLQIRLGRDVGENVCGLLYS
jgi:hypothetical protein